VFFTEKHWENSRENWTGDKKIVVGGRAKPKYRPSFYTGGGGCNMKGLKFQFSSNRKGRKFGSPEKQNFQKNINFSFFRRNRHEKNSARARYGNDANGRACGNKSASI